MFNCVSLHSQNKTENKVYLLKMETKKIYYPLVVFEFLLLLFSQKASCQNFNYRENAVYVYNFIKYTNWPQKKNFIQIGIIGDSPIEEELRALLASKKNSNITYSINKINIPAARSVDVVIISKSATNKLKEVNSLTANMPVLIITEKENLNRSGACISFFIDEDHDYKTGYQLSTRNCTSRGLKINDQIINNAILIR
jgi:hypothetical protein